MELCLEGFKLDDMQKLREKITKAATYRMHLREAVQGIMSGYRDWNKGPAEGLAGCVREIKKYKIEKAEFCKELPALEELFPVGPEISQEKINIAEVAAKLEAIKSFWPRKALRERVGKDYNAEDNAWMLDEKDIVDEKAMTALALKILGTLQTRFRLEVVAETITLPS